MGQQRPPAALLATNGPYLFVAYLLFYQSFTVFLLLDIL